MHRTPEKAYEYAVRDVEEGLQREVLARSPHLVSSTRDEPLPTASCDRTLSECSYPRLGLEKKHSFPRDHGPAQFAAAEAPDLPDSHAAVRRDYSVVFRAAASDRETVGTTTTLVRATGRALSKRTIAVGIRDAIKTTHDHARQSHFRHANPTRFPESEALRTRRRCPKLLKLI